jgi:hypothetical protein
VTRRETLAGFLVVLAGAFGNEACWHSCTEIGCNAPARIELGVPLSPEGTADAELTVCFNDECRTGRLAAATADGQHVTFADAGAAADQVEAYAYAADGRTQLDIEWYIHVRISVGDVFRVRVVDATASEVVDEEFTVEEVSVSYPNGRDCEPACQNVDFGPS